MQIWNEGCARRGGAGLTRRAWMLSCATMAVGVARPRRSGNSVLGYPQSGRAVPDLLVVEPADRGSRGWTAVTQGALLAAGEADRAAMLLGRSFRLGRAGIEDVAGAGNSSRRARAVVHAGDAQELAALLEVAEAWQAPVFNVGSPDDSLRTSQCDSQLFHVCPSAAMMANAVVMWRRSRPDDRVSAVTWHSSLGRFGAAQLNDRYIARFGEPMDADAWCGWMAVKIAWETSARAGAADTNLADTLLRPAAKFDGHKGRALSFRPWDHQLRQPVYLVSGSDRGGMASQQVLGQIPASGSPGRAEALLDELAGPRDPVACLPEVG